MLTLPRISFSKPTFSLRFFIYVLFGLIILVLLAEGGYYFWAQKRLAGQQTKNPFIAREEGIFTYIKSPDGSIQKMILGTIEKIDGNLLTIKTDNNKTVQVLFTGEDVFIGELSSGKADARMGTIEDLLIDDEVSVADISSEKKGEVSAKFLGVSRGK